MRLSVGGALAVRRASRRPQWPCEGGRGRWARAPPSHAARGAVAQAGAARGVRAATEGTLRRDFSEGLFEGSCEGLQHLHKTWFQ
eukprot:scaffold56220_cov66-Phaeocystis_antarctica.AAC.3